MNKLSHTKEVELDCQLNQGEVVKWCAVPKAYYHAYQGLLVMLYGVPFVMISVVWVGASYDLSCIDLSEGLPTGVLFLLPFLLIGLSLVSVPFWLYIRAMQTIYAITDERAIIIEGLFVRRVHSFDGQHLRARPRKISSTGKRWKRSGSIVLHSETDSFQPVRHGFGMNTITKTKSVAFIGVNDVDSVEQLLDGLSQAYGENSRKIEQQQESDQQNLVIIGDKAYSAVGTGGKIGIKMTSLSKDTQAATRRKKKKNARKTCKREARPLDYKAFNIQAGTLFEAAEAGSPFCEKVKLQRMKKWPKKKKVSRQR